jgi:hypothetical protein
MDTDGWSRGAPGLDAYFAAARARTPEPPVALLDAVLADAADALTDRREETRLGVLPARTRLSDGLRGMLTVLGGWKAATAMALCAAIGFGVGVSGWSAAESYVWGETMDYSDVVAMVTDVFDLALNDG